jgi:hypothetical protein
MGLDGKGQYVSNMERGKQGIPLKHVKTLSLALQIPVMEIKAAMDRDFSEQFNRVIYGDM